jgi:single-strand DNA-binding protein
LQGSFADFTEVFEFSMIKALTQKGADLLINQVTLVGRLTRDPELRYTPEGTAVSNVTLAVNRNFRNGDGEYTADFVQCTLWKKTAENTVQYCRKGSIVGIVGRIQTRSYENQDGKKVYVTDVVAETVRFVGTKQAENAKQEYEAIKF